LVVGVLPSAKAGRVIAVLRFAAPRLNRTNIVDVFIEYPSLVKSELAKPRHPPVMSKLVAISRLRRECTVGDRFIFTDGFLTTRVYGQLFNENLPPQT
jgi:hypothetical protein